METLIRRYLNCLGNVSLEYVRDLESKIDWSDRLISVRGQRGVGKTTMLLQHILKTFGDSDTTSVIYASLDNIYFATHGLLDFIETFHQRGGKYLFLDEVHKYQGWSIEVKNAYDEFSDLHIVFTGSSLINILDSEVDLSRRCISYDMQGLSFREYLAMFKGVKLPQMSLDDILSAPEKMCRRVCSEVKPLQFFSEYLQNGYYPFLLEGIKSYAMRIENIVNMIIETELPTMRGLDNSNIRKIKALLSILASGLPMSIDTVKLSKMAEVSRSTLLAYLQHLDAAKIIRLLYSDNHSVKRMQKPDKVYLENTNMQYALGGMEVNLGNIRETFFANQLSYAHIVEYSSSAADFLIDGKYTFEIGGGAKDGRQTAEMENSWIAADDVEHAIGNKLPLWLFGFLY
ncbi:MAG: ATP-binding protein [Prevotella sp.]